MSTTATGDGGELDLEQLAGRVQNLVAVADGVSIVVQECGLLVAAAAVGISRAHIGRVAEVDRTFSGCALRTGRSVVCDDVSANPLVEPGVRHDPRIGSMVTTPLIEDGVTIGLLVVVSSRRGAFSPPLRRRLERIGAGLALVVADTLRRGEGAERRQSERASIARS